MQLCKLLQASCLGLLLALATNSLAAFAAAKAADPDITDHSDSPSMTPAARKSVAGQKVSVAHPRPEVGRHVGRAERDRIQARADGQLASQPLPTGDDVLRERFPSGADATPKS